MVISKILPFFLTIDKFFALLYFSMQGLTWRKEGCILQQIGFLLVYPGSAEDEPITLFAKNEADCAILLNLELCRDATCPDHDSAVGRHSHILEESFGPIQHYPADDPRAKRVFRVYEAAGGDVPITWHYYRLKAKPLVVYYRRQRIVFRVAGKG